MLKKVDLPSNLFRNGSSALISFLLSFSLTFSFPSLSLSLFLSFTNNKDLSYKWTVLITTTHLSCLINFGKLVNYGAFWKCNITHLT